MVPGRAAALRYWLRLGCISFGGPAGQIAILHREVVAARGWISEAEFVRALNFCMLLPGPEALQLVIYLGWRWHGLRGGIVAGLCFLLPAALLLTGLSFVYVLWGALAPVAAAVAGLQAVVVALVGQALWRIGRRALGGPWQVALAAGAFVALAFARVPFPLVIFGAALLGALLLPPAAHAAAPAGPAPRRRRALAILATGALLWLAPWLAALAAGAFPARLYLFFSQAALLGFGGAYALLAYVNAQLVHTLGWLTPPQLLAGLALAETTPGPLILVLQFYGFVAGWNAAAPHAPAAAALGGAALAGWATFLPSFVLVLAGAPYVERLAANGRLGAALEAVTAAVVGVIATFALAVARGVLLPAGPAAAHWGSVAIAAAAALALTRTRIGLPWVLAGGALAALAAARLGLA